MACRILVIAGKGGVGRSTLALAAAREAARTRRVALAEVHGATTIAHRCGVPATAVPTPVAPGLDLFSLDADTCLGAYTADRLPRAPLAGAVFRSRLVRAFLDGVPGMGDLLHLGFLNALLEQGFGGLPPWDLLVIDPPPTGHGISFTIAADAMARMTAQGPIHDESARIADRLADPAFTRHLVAALPERLPVSEALQLVERLGSQRETVGAMLVNRVVPDPFEQIAWDVMRPVVAAEEPALETVGAHLARRATEQREAIGTLRSQTSLPVVLLPEVEDLADLEPLLAEVLS